MANWRHEAWGGLGRKRFKWLESRRFEEGDSYPIWIAEMRGIAERLQQEMYLADSRGWAVLNHRGPIVFKWQPRGR